MEAEKVKLVEAWEDARRGKTYYRREVAKEKVELECKRKACVAKEKHLVGLITFHKEKIGKKTDEVAILKKEIVDAKAKAILATENAPRLQWWEREMAESDTQLALLYTVQLNKDFDFSFLSVDVGQIIVRFEAREAAEALLPNPFAPTTVDTCQGDGAAAPPAS